MVFNSTYNNKDDKKTINNIVGNPYSLIQSIKLKGIGSKRMMINDASPNLKKYLNTIADVNYANIELRPKGVLIHINKGLTNFTWAIPFYQLVIYKTNGASIHAQGKFIHFKNNQTFKENKNFFEKLMSEKVKFDEQYKFQNIE